MIKLIASDIDGTLLPEGTDQMNPGVYEAIRRLKEKGVVFAAASGRQYESMVHVMEPVKNDIIFISEHGANVICRGKTISSDLVPRELVEELIRYFRTRDDFIMVVSTAESMYTESKDPAFWNLQVNGYHFRMRYVEDILAEELEIIKLAVYRGEGAGELAPPIIDRWKDRLNCMMGGRNWIDFVGRGTDKGNALAQIQRRLNISKAETMAFGDNTNDMGMLKQAGESYAVENANPLLKEAAKHIAPKNTEDGVLQVLEQLLREMEEEHVSV